MDKASSHSLEKSGSHSKSSLSSSAIKHPKKKAPSIFACCFPMKRNMNFDEMESNDKDMNAVAINGNGNRSRRGSKDDDQKSNAAQEANRKSLLLRNRSKRDKHVSFFAPLLSRKNSIETKNYYECNEYSTFISRVRDPTSAEDEFIASTFDFLIIVAVPTTLNNINEYECYIQGKDEAISIGNDLSDNNQKITLQYYPVEQYYYDNHQEYIDSYNDFQMDLMSLSKALIVIVPPCNEVTLTPIQMKMLTAAKENEKKILLMQSTTKTKYNNEMNQIFTNFGAKIPIFRYGFSKIKMLCDIFENSGALMPSRLSDSFERAFFELKNGQLIKMDSAQSTERASSQNINISNISSGDQMISLDHVADFCILSKHQMNQKKDLLLQLSFEIRRLGHSVSLNEYSTYRYFGKHKILMVAVTSESLDTLFNNEMQLYDIISSQIENVLVVFLSFTQTPAESARRSSFPKDAKDADMSLPSDINKIRERSLWLQVDDESQLTIDTHMKEIFDFIDAQKSTTTDLGKLLNSPSWILDNVLFHHVDLVMQYIIAKARLFCMGSRSWLISKIDSWATSLADSPQNNRSDNSKAVGSSNNIFILSSSKGMGKTVFLAELCRRRNDQISCKMGTTSNDVIMKTNSESTTTTTTVSSSSPSINKESSYGFKVAAFYFVDSSLQTSDLQVFMIKSITLQLSSSIPGYRYELPNDFSSNSSFAHTFQEFIVDPLIRSMNNNKFSKKIIKSLVIDGLDPEVPIHAEILSAMISIWKHLPSDFGLVISLPSSQSLDASTSSSMNDNPKSSMSMRQLKKVPSMSSLSKKIKDIRALLDFTMGRYAISSQLEIGNLILDKIAERSQGNYLYYSLCSPMLVDLAIKKQISVTELDIQLPEGLDGLLAKILNEMYEELSGDLYRISLGTLLVLRYPIPEHLWIASINEANPVLLQRPEVKTRLMYYMHTLGCLGNKSVSSRGNDGYIVSKSTVFIYHSFISQWLTGDSARSARAKGLDHLALSKEQRFHKYIGQACNSLITDQLSMKKIISALYNLREQDLGAFRSTNELSNIVSLEVKYACKNVVFHLVEAGDKSSFDSARTQFLQFERLFLKTLINRSGVQSSISDAVHYLKKRRQMALLHYSQQQQQQEGSVTPKQKRNSYRMQPSSPDRASTDLRISYQAPKQDASIEMLLGALRLSTRIIESNPKMLASQLLSRIVLPLESVDDINKLLEGAKLFLSNGERFAWCPLYSDLTKSSDVLIASFRNLGSNASYCTFSSLPHCDILISCNGTRVKKSDGLLSNQSAIIDELSDKIRIHQSSGGNNNDHEHTDFTCRLWDPYTGDLIVSLDSHTKDVVFCDIFGESKIMTASHDKTVNIWEVDVMNRSKSLLHRLVGHNGSVNCARFNKNGELIVTCSSDSHVNLWKSSGSFLTSFKGHTSDVISCEFSQTGKRLILSCSSDSSAKLWTWEEDSETENVINNLITSMRHEGSVNSAHFSNSDEFIVTASDDKKVKIWSISIEIDVAANDSSIEDDLEHVNDNENVNSTLESREIFVVRFVRSLNGHKDAVNNAKFSPDSTKVISASKDTTAKVWNVRTGEIICNLQHVGDVNYAEFSPDSLFVITGSSDCTAKIWDSTNGLLFSTFNIHRSLVNCVRFSDNGQFIATASHDESVCLWNARKATSKLQEESDVTVDISKIRNENGSTPTKSIATPISSALRQRVDSSSRTIRSGSDVSEISDAKSQRPINLVDLFQDRIQFSQDGSMAAIVFDPPKYPSVFITETGKLISTMEKSLKPNPKKPNEIDAPFCTCLCFSPMDDIIASGFSDGSIKLWNPLNGQIIRSEKAHISCIRCIQYSTNGQVLATSSDDKTVKLWDMKSNSLLKTLTGHHASITSIKFSQDGEKVVSCSDDKSCKIYFSKTGEQDFTFPHLDCVKSACFSSHAGLLVTSDGVGRVWDTNSGRLVSTLKTEDTLHSVQFSLDDKYVIARKSGAPNVIAFDALTGDVANSINMLEIKTIGNSCYVPTITRLKEESHMMIKSSKENETADYQAEAQSQDTYVLILGQQSVNDSDVIGYAVFDEQISLNSSNLISMRPTQSSNITCVSTDGKNAHVVRLMKKLHQ